MSADIAYGSTPLSAQFPVVVTSYEIALRDRPFLQRLRWKLMVVDEGHRLKNMNCRLIVELKRYPSENRLLLTGKWSFCVSGFLPVH